MQATFHIIQSFEHLAALRPPKAVWDPPTPGLAHGGSWKRQDNNSAPPCSQPPFHSHTYTAGELERCGGPPLKIPTWALSNTQACFEPAGSTTLKGIRSCSRLHCPGQRYCQVLDRCTIRSAGLGRTLTTAMTRSIASLTKGHNTLFIRQDVLLSG